MVFGRYHVEVIVYWTLKIEILRRFKTQRAFAKACGKPEDWLSRVICGVREPTEEEQRLICEKLGVDDPSQIFGE